MKAKSAQTKSKKTLLIVMTILFLIAAGIVGYLFLIQSKGSASKTNPQQQTSDTQGKKDFIENSGGQASDGGQAPTDPQNIILAFSTNNSDDTETVLTKLIGYSDGTCDLTITNGSNQYTKSTSVIYQPEYSTCAGFSVPISDLGVGTWSIKLVVTSKGTALTKTTTVSVTP